jgi:hypothetical protein
MHKLYDLKEFLVDELEKRADKKDMSPAELELVDKLAHAAKNVCKIIEYCDEDRGGGSYAMRGPSFQSYGRGRNAARDSRGRYSSEDRYYRSADDIRNRLQDLMYDAPTEEMRGEIQHFMTRLDTM